MYVAIAIIIATLLFLGLAASIPAMLIVEHEREERQGE